MSRHRRQQRRRMRVGARTAFIRMLARVRGDFSAAQVDRLVFSDSEFLRLLSNRVTNSHSELSPLTDDECTQYTDTTPQFATEWKGEWRDV